MKRLCEQMQDQMTDHVLGLLDSHQQETLLKHIKTCAACETALRKTEEKHSLLSAIGNQFGTDMPDRIDRCITALNQSEAEPSAKLRIQWRHIMATPIAKIAAAAVIVIAAVLAITFFDKSVITAYAIEQTIEANRSLRFIHLKCEPAERGVEELWAEFDTDGKLLRLRMNFPNTSDGPKDVIWQEGKARVWFKAKNSIAVVRDKDMLAKSKMYYESFDPKRIVEKLYQAQGSENVQIIIDESAAEGEPITITMTRKGSPDVRAVFKIDPETKLLQQEEKYKLEDEEYKFLDRTIYLDYNQPIDPSIFVFDPPSDVLRTDQTTQEVGIAKGALSDEEAAVEVTRQFIQALADKDYTKAGKLFGGLPGARLKELLAEIDSMRLVSVGKPEPHPETGGLRVPYQVESSRLHSTPDRYMVNRIVGR
jgi:hypothetical protein